MVREALTWLAGTRWSVSLHESLWVWPLLESTHVLALAWFVGSAVALDLRLLGVTSTAIPARTYTERLLPWTRAGFAVMVITGGLLFTATPVTYYESLFFRIKVVLLLVAGINVWYFHGRTQATIASWDAGVRPPRAARVAAMVSLGSWAGVVVAGRLVAYNWFACELQTKATWVTRLSGCQLP
jgi:hypothetical protein